MVPSCTMMQVGVGRALKPSAAAGYCLLIIVHCKARLLLVYYSALSGLCCSVMSSGLRAMLSAWHYPAPSGPVILRSLKARSMERSISGWKGLRNRLASTGNCSRYLIIEKTNPVGFGYRWSGVKCLRSGPSHVRTLAEPLPAGRARKAKTRPSERVFLSFANLRKNQLTLLETIFARSNIDTWFLPPNSARSLSSALIIRLFILSCKPFFLM